MSDILALYEVAEIFHTMKVLSFFLSRKLVSNKNIRDEGLLFFVPCIYLETVFSSKYNQTLSIYSKKI